MAQTGKLQVPKLTRITPKNSRVLQTKKDIESCHRVSPLMRFTCEKVTEVQDELADVIKGQVFFFQSDMIVNSRNNVCFNAAVILPANSGHSGCLSAQTLKG